MWAQHMIIQVHILFRIFCYCDHMGYWHIISCTRDVVKRCLWPVKTSPIVKGLWVWFVECTLRQPAVAAYVRDRIHCIPWTCYPAGLPAWCDPGFKRKKNKAKEGQSGCPMASTCAHHFTCAHTPVYAWTGTYTHTRACVWVMLTLYDGWRMPFLSLLLQELYRGRHSLALHRTNISSGHHHSQLSMASRHKTM